MNTLKTSVTIFMVIILSACGGGNSSQPEADITAPVITLSGDNPASVIQNSSYIDAGATATDAIDGTVSVITTGAVDTSVANSYTLTYTAADQAGNTETKTRTVVVTATQDTTPPLAPALISAPTTTLADSENAEVSGEVGATLWVNGIQVGIIGVAGTFTINLDTSGADGAKTFVITLKDNSNNVSQALNISIEHITIRRASALKLLRQAAFTSDETNLAYIQTNGHEAWVDAQLNTVGDLDNTSDTKYGYLESILRLLQQAYPDRYTDEVIADPDNYLDESHDTMRFVAFNRSVWWQKALHNEDQLRQRVAYALSQLLVVSERSPIGNALHFKGDALASYYDILVKHSFGNYRDLLKDVTMSSTMSYYLTYVGNKKANATTGTAPDENYARELMQLFTIGLYELNLDGTKKQDNNGRYIPTYTQDDVSELSKVFTGWDWQSRKVPGDQGYWSVGYGSTSYYNHILTRPVEFTEQYHEYAEKTVLGQRIEANLSGEADIDRALDILMANANMAPHVARHLIMRLVTSNPTPGYIQRVASVFNNNGIGVKGDMRATVRAILLDPEARGETIVANFGKVDEFVLATTHFLSAFKVSPLPFFTLGTSRVENTYWFTPTTQFYPQAALKAESVFNFYSPEFVPSDSYFASNKLVSPEMQIRTNSGLMGFSNLLFTLFNYERYRMIELGLYNPSSASNMEEWTTHDNPTHSRFRNLYIDVTDVYNYFETELDGDPNGDFTHLNSTETGHRSEVGETGVRAIEALIEYLDSRLLSETMPEYYKQQLLEHLSGIGGHDQRHKAQVIVPIAIRAIVTSPLYMVLK